MGRLLLTTALAVMILSGLITAARMIGATGESSRVAAVLATGECPQPCWNGIRPGHTTRRQSEEILRNLAFSRRKSSTACWQKSGASLVEACLTVYLPEPGRPVDSIILFFPSVPVRLGDIISVYGKPIASRLCVNPRAPAIAVRGYVFFKGDVRAVVISPTRPTERRFSPDMIVNFVSYYPEGVWRTALTIPRWAGFTGRQAQWQC